MNPGIETHDNPCSASNKGLTLAELERVYDQLAAAIDQAGVQDTERFLVKLALLSAQALGDGACFENLVNAALKDL